MLTDLKEFEKFLKTCRKQGVTEVTFAGATIKFGDMPTKATQAEESDEIPTDGMTPEQLMYYAVSDSGVQA